MEVNVIGAGLAGVEATYQLIKRGHKVRLYEMRPIKSTEAHHTANFAELVCSNSLRSNSLNNAVGILKEEMRRLDSVIMKYASLNEIPAGTSLAVDREKFSSDITEFIKSHPLVTVINEEVVTIPDGPTIITTGPLTSPTLSLEIKKLIGSEYLSFYDAAAPLIFKSSVDFDKVYLKSRYDKEEAAYYNCPMTKEEYQRFYDELVKAEIAVLKDFEKGDVFEGCMPVEVMAKRGIKTLLFGPLKPVGLETEEIKPYAVVQLRSDDSKGELLNIVGFQTNLKFGEQQRVFSLIPGLENMKIARYGVMHKNTFINSPTCLTKYYQFRNRSDLFFAGQLTGVEGYVESAASGIVAGINMALYLEGKELIDFTDDTIIGSMANYISDPRIKKFQPMNANFGLLRPLTKVKKDEKSKAYLERSMSVLDERIARLHE